MIRFIVNGDWTVGQYVYEKRINIKAGEVIWYTRCSRRCHTRKSLWHRDHESNLEPSITYKLFINKLNIYSESQPSRVHPIYKPKRKFMETVHLVLRESRNLRLYILKISCGETSSPCWIVHESIFSGLTTTLCLGQKNRNFG